MICSSHNLERRPIRVGAGEVWRWVGTLASPSAGSNPSPPVNASAPPFFYSLETGCFVITLSQPYHIFDMLQSCLRYRAYLIGALSENRLHPAQVTHPLCIAILDQRQRTHQL